MTGFFLAALLFAPGPDGAVVYKGKDGPGKGHHIVFLAGDEEYRSEEGLPQLAKILAVRHGFTCTVVFSMAKDGTIDPTVQDSQPGIGALDHADLCVMLLRFRQWDPRETVHFAKYLASQKPFLGLRTSTHAFNYPNDPNGLHSKDRGNDMFARYGWDRKDWPGGFGKQILGETWVSHWGQHGVQATRGVFEPGRQQHPLLQGVDGLFGTTDVYEAHPPADSEVVVRGQVLSGLLRSDPPATGRKKTAQGVEQDLNDPMMPIVWTRKRGKSHTVTCTMGAATDLLDDGLRRMLVNSVYWQLGMKVPAKANVDLVGDYNPSPFGFGKYKKGVKPSDLALPEKG